MEQDHVTTPAGQNAPLPEGQAGSTIIDNSMYMAQVVPQQNGPAPGAPAPQGWYAPGGVAPGTVAMSLPQPVKKLREPFSAGRKDGIFTVACLLSGILFIYWVLFTGFAGWGVTAMALIYAASLVVYARSLKIEIKGETVFWLAVFALTALSYCLHGQWSFGGWRGLFTFVLAVYLNGSIFGVLLQGKTGNAMVLDGVNLLFCVPFKNIDLTRKGLAALRDGAGDKTDGGTEKTKETKKKENRGKIAGILIGLALCLVILPVILPLLMEADSGGFSNAMRGVNELFERLFAGDWVINLVKLALGAVVGLYLFWLAAGCAHRRYTTSIDVKKMGRDALVLKKLPVSSAAMVLGLVCAVYVLFIATQIPYFFSAFTGKLPAGFLTYSEYARKGFFELCGIAAINLTIMLATAVFLRVHVAESRATRGLLAALSVLTILLVVTAESKMLLYIGAYGLSPKRILTSVFLVFLACVCAAVIVLLFKWFSITRFAVILGSAMVCALCMVNVDDVSVRYNAARYLESGGSEFIVGPGWGSEAGGYESALQVYEAMPDGEERDDLGLWLRDRRLNAIGTQWTTRDTVGNAGIRAAADAEKKAR